MAVFFESEATEEIGAAAIYKRQGDSGRSLDFFFCPNCGSTVFWKPEFRPGLTAVALGCFSDKQGFNPGQEVYLEHRDQWVSIAL